MFVLFTRATGKSTALHLALGSHRAAKGSVGLSAGICRLRVELHTVRTSWCSRTLNTFDLWDCGFALPILFFAVVLHTAGG